MYSPTSLLWIKIRSIFLNARIQFKKNWLEFAVTSLIIAGVMIGGYLLFTHIAHFLLKQGEIGELLLNRVFYLGWSIIFYLLIISNTVTAFSTLYRSPEISFLFTTPLSYQQIFRIKFIENLVYSSWAILLFGLPLILAYGNVKSLSLGNILAILVFGLIPYLVIATAVSLCILMVVIRLSKWFKMRSIFVILGTIFVLFFWLYFKYSQRETLLGGEWASFRLLNKYMINLSATPFPLIPSYWLSKLFATSTLNHWNDFAFFTGLAISTALVTIELSGFTAKFNYFITFQMMEVSASYSSKHSHKRYVAEQIEKTFGKIKWLSPQTRGLMMKDMLEFLRTPQQWMQFLLLSFFIGIYLINLSRADVQLATMSKFWGTLIHLFNFGFSGFVLAALIARFVFPLISLEGKGMWALLTSPINFIDLFKEKFLLSFAIFFTITEIVALVTNYYLSQSALVSAITTVFLFLMSLSLISISLGLGAVFPQFQESNPMKIGSSRGGIITVILSMIYVAAMVGTLVWIVTLIKHGLTLVSLIPIFAGVLLINLTCIYLPLRWGLRALVGLASRNIM